MSEEEKAAIVVASPPPPVSLVDVGIDFSKKAAKAALSRYREMMTFAKTILEEGVDYGPPFEGSKKKTLLQPGMDKLIAHARLRPKFTVLPTSVIDFETPFFNYEVRCELYFGDQCVGEGIGSCNSYESKYRYRWVSERDLEGPQYSHLRKEELVQKRVKWGVLYRVENMDVADQSNTILKMASKRAKGHAVQTAFGLSSEFTHDYGEDEDAPPVDIPSAPPPPPRRQQSMTPPPPEDTPPDSLAIKRRIRMGVAYLQGTYKLPDEHVERAMDLVARKFNVDHLEMIGVERLDEMFNYFKSSEFREVLEQENLIPMRRG